MRLLFIGLIVLGLMGSVLVEATFPANSINKVVIGVLDLETVGGSSITSSPLEQKKALMKELKRNTRVSLVDIRESCGLSDLKKKPIRKGQSIQEYLQPGCHPPCLCKGRPLREVGENDENHKVRRYAKRAYEQISGEKF